MPELPPGRVCHQQLALARLNDRFLRQNYAPKKPCNINGSFLTRFSCPQLSARGFDLTALSDVLSPIIIVGEVVMLKWFIMGALALFSASIAKAGDCDAALVKVAYNSTAVTHDDWRLSLLITNDNYEQAKHDAGASAVIYGVPVGAKYSDYDENRSQMFQSHSESRTIDEMRNLAWTALDPNAVTAYSECLQANLAAQNGLHAVVTSATPTNIAILVKWDVPAVSSPANVRWDPPSIGASLERSIPHGTTTIIVPRPRTKQNLTGNFQGYTTGAIVLEPLPPPMKPIPPCKPETVSIPAKNYIPSQSSNVQIGVLPYGDDVIHNGPPYNDQPNKAQYKIYIPCAGRYLIRIENAAAVPRPVYLSLQNSTGFKFSRQLIQKATGTWMVQVFTDDGDDSLIDLPAGELTMELSRTSVFPHIRTIEFTPVL